MGNRNSRREVTAEEARLWRNTMRDVTVYEGRLPESAAPPPPVSPPAAPPPVAPPPPPAPRITAVPPPRPLPLAHDTAPGVDRRTAERLRRGDLAVEAALDLHGLSQDAAHAALLRFISVSAELGRRCLLVITGKGNREGGGVLRGQVPRWLNEAAFRPRIIAFSYAQPRHGGEGALYVLLKRRR